MTYSTENKEKALISELLGEELIRYSFDTVSEVLTDESAIPALSSDDFFEVALITDGVGVHCVFDKRIPCKTGDIYITPPEIPHAFFRVQCEDSLIIRRLRFSPADWFKSETATVGSRRYHGIFSDGSPIAYAMLNSRMRGRIDTLLDGIEYELQDKEDEWRTIVRTYLVQLFAFTARYINRSVKNPQAKGKDNELVCAAIKILESEYSDCELSLDSVSKRLFLSSSHLSRSFKQYTGQLFSEHLREIRLNHSKELLSGSELAVEKIVSNCGFRDVSSFYRNFREAFDMTPQIFRQVSKFSAEAADSIINKERENTKMSILNEISANVQIGKSKIVKELVQQAIDQGIAVSDILNEGLLSGMGIVGEKFKNNEIYVPEVLVSARAMNMGAQLLKPLLAASGITATGKVCLGTVQGDLHDIGKNLVKMMLEGKGLEVVDLGTDVAPEAFIKAAIEENCQVICCSALLTTTMAVMEEVVKAAEAAGIRDKVKIMIGGAPVNQEFCDKIGADCYTVDAASAADAAVEFCKA